MNILKSLLYRLYERRLIRDLREGLRPKHLGVILDGNRRYALEKNMDHVWGHEKGFENVERLIRWCLELDIKELTLYAFSTENFHRSPEEVEALMDLLERACERVKKEPDIHKNRVRIRTIGRTNLLPERVQNAIRRMEEATAGYDNFHLNMAISYGGRAEIIDAIKGITRKVQEGTLAVENIDEEVVSRHLYKEDMLDADMIIRTSGEMRLSGFLMWQSAYSELYFAEAFFPGFRKVDFLRALRIYQQRERRHGK
ncbi:MAG: polyprenyl diphosphate synthase [Planctomycetota bacterium]|jgi:tritrans,polycis-undecaprenyl-diphosphate synthase [geranylgeranyl-diphosphate specific]